MENNKLLVGIQFTYRDANSNYSIRDSHIELYVLRDISLRQLLTGIRYGLRKLSALPHIPRPESEMYRQCCAVFEECVDEYDPETAGSIPDSDRNRTYRLITLTSYKDTRKDVLSRTGQGFAFYLRDWDKPICQLGFITSSRIIFNVAESNRNPAGRLTTSFLIKAFDPACSDRIFFPAYNISSRQLYRFDMKPVKIIPPSDPPKKPRQNLLMMLIPPLSTAVLMFLARMFLMQGSNGFRMGILSAVMCVSVIISTVFTGIRQRREFRRDIAEWRVGYENYINRLMRDIEKRQKEDAKKMDELYPDVFSLIQEDGKGIYSMNRNLYSRSPRDEDFLTFRVGVSRYVESRFEIQGEAKDAVLSEADFLLEPGQDGKLIARLFLHNEGKRVKNLLNLYRLPETVAEKYKYMEEAPLLYNLRSVGALGVVDAELARLRPASDAVMPSAANYFIMRMIFELCYYHSPDDLQFVMFFPPERNSDNMERVITPYKFMPHFRELFSDRSQFVFDEASADLILSGLLTLMGRRQADGYKERVPHVVLIVYYEYSLKEHAFAEFLPAAPLPGKPYENKLGLSFVYLSGYWEYLPPYCDDVVRIENGSNDKSGGDFMILTPRADQRAGKSFAYPKWDAEKKGGEERLNIYWGGVFRDFLRAYRFFSAIYYTRIAQNGKVPSMVTMFEMIERKNEEIEDYIQTNWGISASGGERTADITESMAVRLGKTETSFTYLDLHEKADGPHMLVAGTTGSGKTETIITYLLSLCMRFKPDELNLLLVDMKGGGFTKRIGKLPHVVGAVTDVDGDENGAGAEYMLRRFLDAMRSEIKRRKLLFNRLRVDNIDAYIKNSLNIEDYIKGLRENSRLSDEEAEQIRRAALDEPLSHLILVVDEFTELKRFSNESKEKDMDFMSEITTIARIGRSLGVHIILISQNIEGAITDDIRVNSNARLCLRVATKQASKEMIGSDVAASPSMPGHGRAYLLVGTGAKFIYFQSGYSMAGTAENEEIPVEITLASKRGGYSPFYQSEKDNDRLKERKKKENQGQNQLERIVQAIQTIYQRAKGVSVREPRMVFRPPLPAKILMKDGKLFDLSQTRPSEFPPESGRDSNSPSRVLKFAVGIYDAPLDQKQPILYLDILRRNIAVFGSSMTGKTTFLKTLLVRAHEQTSELEENIFIIDFGGALRAYADLPRVRACFDNSNEENIKRIFRTVEKRLEENINRLNLLSSGGYYDLAVKSPEKCPPHITLIIENLNAFLSDERYALYQEKLTRFCRDGLSKGLSVAVTANDTAGTGRLMAYFGQKISFEMPSEAYFDIFNQKISRPMQNPGRGLASLESGVYEFQCFLPFAPSNEREGLENLRKSAPGIPENQKLKAFTGDLGMEICQKAVDENELCVGLDYYEHSPVCLNIQNIRAVAIYGKRKFGKTNLLNLILRGILEKHPKYRFVLLDDGRKELANDESHLAAFYRAKPDYKLLTDLDKFWDYLYQNGYWSQPRGDDSRRSRDIIAEQRKAMADGMSLPTRGLSGAFHNRSPGLPGATESDESIPPAPFTVFVLQNRKLFQDVQYAAPLMRSWFQEAVGDAEKKNYLFIFSDARTPSDPDTREILKTNLSAAFLLDNIGEFAADKGAKSVFGEMDAKELKTEYARCSVGDGYYYDIGADELTKLKFVRFRPDQVMKNESDVENNKTVNGRDEP